MQNSSPHSPNLESDSSGFSPKITREFEAEKTELLTGGCLIEANAGSGKTFSIVKIFLRLIIEKGISPRKILAVTFTKASAAELKERIVHELTDYTEKFIHSENFTHLEPGVQKKIRTISAELSDLSVFTIHGFCQRFSEEFCLDVGARPDLIEPGSENLLIETASKDIWRSFLYQKTDLLATFFADLFPDPGKLFKICKEYLNLPGIQIRPEKPEINPEVYAQEYEEIRIELLQIIEVQNFADWLEDQNPKITDSKKRTLRNKLEALHQALQEGKADWCEALEDLTEILINKSFFEKYPEVGKHSFFILARKAQKIHANLFYYCIHEVDAKLDVQLKKLKRQAEQKDYQDLISDVQNSLEVRPELCQKIDKLYEAALIDEFQDTDAIQYEIFTKLFRKDSIYLYWIGDPKQSIYRFRGADIFVYERAKQEVPPERQYTLSKNWRSHPSAVQAVNFLFGRPGNPFVYDFIDYHDSEPQKSKEEKLYFEKEILEGIGICSVFAETSAQREEIIAKDVASRIYMLLNREAYFTDEENKKKRVTAADIAVLTRSHDQRELIGKNLNSFGIPFFGGGDASKANVLNTEEAKQILKLQRILLNPFAQTPLRSFLSEPPIQKTAEYFLRAGKNPEEFLQDRSQFLRYQKIWMERGFFAAFSAFARDFHLSARHCKTGDELLRIIHYFHLAEIISEIIENTGVGIGVSHRKYQKLLENPPGNERFEIKSLSSRGAVKILTIHAAKGLEFPIVFCPFLGFQNSKKNMENPAYCPFMSFKNPVAKSKKYSLFQDSDSARRVLELLPVNKERENKEFSAETMRVAYVAMTRAKYYTLIHYPEKSNPGNRIIWEAFVGCEQIQFVSEEASAVHAEGLISTNFLGLNEHCAPEFSRKFEPPKPLFSFTSMTRKEKTTEEDFRIEEIFGEKSPEKEWTDEPSSSISGENTILTFPKGPLPGVFWHELLEQISHRNFSGPFFPEFHSLLELHAISEKWIPVIETTLKRIGEIRLNKEFSKYCLKDLPPEKVFCELEFNISICPEVKEKLRQIFDRPEFKQLPPIHQKNLKRLHSGVDEGFLRGFIDLLFEWEEKFYILDWKSNFLGNRPEDYSPEKLNAEMEKHDYALQYLIYSLAIQTYLLHTHKNYILEENFGGVYYLFLRGLLEDSDNEPRTLYFDSMNSCGVILKELAETILTSATAPCNL